MTHRLFRSVPFLFLLAFVLLSPLRAPAGQADADMVGRVGAVVAHAVAEGRIVGAVVVVGRNGKVLCREAFGMADRETGVPMRVGTLFRLASMSKPLVSATALALVDAGAVSLDDPVTRWLPYFTPRLSDGAPAVVTVRQLLTHTAGLSYGFYDPPDGALARAGVSDGMDRPGISLEENLRRLAGVPLAFAPGTSWRYSLAIDVLGAVVEKASGLPLPEAVAKFVTGPLGMRDTTFLVTDAARLATPYVHGKQPLHRMADPEVLPTSGAGIRFSPARATDATAYPSGGAGMSGTADEYYAFLEAMRRDGGGVLRPETARAMTSDQLGGLPVGLVDKGRTFGFGGAVLVDPAQAGFPGKAGTWSWGGVYGTHFFMDRASGLSVVVLTNTTTDGLSGAFPAQIAQAVYGE